MQPISIINSIKVHTQHKQKQRQFRKIAILCNVFVYSTFQNVLLFPLRF